ncbi:PREDICTED: nucleoplasmin-like, partial [Leptosomus discolor]|uniref:nucleoplasmin-like n=1 Tax=Leptosomus discolor TaxID=188344 RepID=UPI0005228570
LLSEERHVAALWGTDLRAPGGFGGTRRQEGLGGWWPCPESTRGCELSADARSCVVKENDDFLEHLVLLRTICLGAGARDEPHVVAVDSKNTYRDHKPVPIAALRSSVLPMISLKGLELVPPVTFVLKCGTGPVYLSGQHVTLEDDAKSEAHEEELSEEDLGIALPIACLDQRDKVFTAAQETQPEAAQNKQPLK